jgi:tetratricopeptide (TPR) repeat protein
VKINALDAPEGSRPRVGKEIQRKLGIKVPRNHDRQEARKRNRATLIWRLARLSEIANRALEAAAVLGREFEFEVLGQMSELGKDAMVSAVEEALSRRLVVETQDGGRPRYAFTHALVHHTLVEELSLPRRQPLHLKAALAIEAVHEGNLDPHVSALASHYRMAGAAADAQKTIDYSIRAGSAAYALFAYEEAGAHWRAALEVMDEQCRGERKRRAELLWLLGGSPGVVSSGAEAVDYLEAAAALFEELGDNQAACDVHLRLAENLSTENVGAMDMRRAMAYFRKAETFLAEQPESPRHALFHMSMASACSFTMRIADGLAAAKRAMEITEHMDPHDQRQLADHRLGAGFLGAARIDVVLDAYWSIAAGLSSVFLIRSGSVTEGLRLLDQARRRGDQIDEMATGSGVAGIGAIHHSHLRNSREMQEWCKRELAKPRTAHAVRRVAQYAAQPNLALGLHYLLVTACVLAGELTKARAYLAEVDATQKPQDLLFFEGKWESAAKMQTAASERSRRTGSRLVEVSSACQLARSHLFTGERAQAVQVLQRALEISVDGGDILFELFTRSALARIAGEANDSRETLPHLLRCREIVSAGENWFGIGGFVELAEAVVAAAQGEYAAAETHFEKAIATLQHCWLPWEEADTVQWWGRALLAASQPARAIEKFDAAIEIYRSHGAGMRFIEYVMADKRGAEGTAQR